MSLQHRRLIDVLYNTSARFILSQSASIVGMPALKLHVSPHKTAAHLARCLVGGAAKRVPAATASS